MRICRVACGHPYMQRSARGSRPEFVVHVALLALMTDQLSMDARSEDFAWEVKDSAIQARLIQRRIRGICDQPVAVLSKLAQDIPVLLPMEACTADNPPPNVY
jgi:hypothetical protein